MKNVEFTDEEFELLEYVINKVSECDRFMGQIYLDQSERNMLSEIQTKIGEIK
jgi:hypothetical protein